MDSAGFAQLAPLTQLGTAFLAGFLTSLTPCVYPLIPVTLAIFGATSEKSYLRAFLLSATYVLGIALTYTTLGILSAASGNYFGAFLGRPAVIVLLVIFFVILALFTLDLVRFRFISRLQTRASVLGGKGFSGALLMGLASGLVAAPCVGPVLVIILTLAAASQSIYWSAALFFSYSIGLGLIFLILGTFSGLIARLPRSGQWLNLIKFITSVALLWAAQSAALPLVHRYSEFGVHLNLNALLLLGLFALLLAWYAYRTDRRLLKISAALILSVLVSPYTTFQRPAVELSWHTSIEAALLDAKTRQTFTMVDLYADWCAACKELDRRTFANERVKEKLAAFALARIDFTDANDAVAKISEKYGVVGLPCVIFFDLSGHEITAARLTGFVEAQEFLAHLERYVKK